MKKAFLLCVILLLGGIGGLGDAVSHAPIAILSDNDFTVEKGVVGGSGLPSDPYVIAGWKIDASAEDYGILIEGTTRAFVIRDVEIVGASKAGIRLATLRYGMIEGGKVAGCLTGVALQLVENVQVVGLEVEECEDALRIMFSSRVELRGLRIKSARVGVWVSGTTDLVLSDSQIAGCDLGVQFELAAEGNVIAGNAFLGCRIPAYSQGGNRWDDGALGNYWEGFHAPDDNGDGILDVPYSIGADEDRFPLAVPPVE